MHKAKRKARERKAPKPPSQPVNKERVCNECGAIVANLSNHMQVINYIVLFWIMHPTRYLGALSKREDNCFQILWKIIVLTV